jgi:hypothetical protein
MSYSPQEFNLQIDRDLKEISKKMSVCKKVCDTLDSDGWNDILSPLLDRMIIDVVGGKIGDTWVSGKLDRAKKEERREFYIGYKQALIDFHARAYFHAMQLDKLKEQQKDLTASKQERYRQPLVEDTSYGVQA